MTETEFQAAVDGGTLHGSEWRRDATGMPVLALHGITANHRSFVPLAERLDQRMLAIDLRGRGRSRDLPAPYGLDRLADDAAAALDAAGIDRAVAVGHSMGGFVAALLADRHPDRVAALVLVDGGLPLAPVADPAAVLGPAVERLSMTFASRADYRAFWQRHPALGPWWSAAIEAYVDYDLVETDGGLRPTAIPEAVTTAMLSLADDATARALERTLVPATLLTSPRGLLDESPGLYGESDLAAWRLRLPRLDVQDVQDTNHYTILMGAGVDRVATAVQQAVDLASAPGKHAKERA